MVQCSGFRCTDGQCLAMVWKCDGQSDCEDGSDEDPLLCKNITCLHNQFQCHSGQCIASNLVCNGIRDCTDSSDENVCPAMQCSSEEFLCGLECISANLLCDGKIDCAGGHDESIKMCKSVSENHCATDEFYCDEECVPFAWRCDGHTDCEDETDEENCEVALLLFNSTSFAKVDINGVRMEDFPFAREKMTALSVDLISSELFWINGEEKGIFRKSFGKNDRQSIIQHVSTAKCITVDWIHKLVFWIDSEFSTISVANYDGSKRKILYKGNISVPSSMAVDPVTGFVFWSDIGDKAKIEKVAINGESRIPLVTVNIKRPVALTLDIKHSLVYWVDSELNTISKIGMGGQHQKVILHSAQFLAKPTGIAVFQDKIFWSDLKHEAIYSIQNNLHSKPTAVTSMTQPLGLLILAREIQPDGVNLCLEHRECPFLYVPSPSNSETKQAKPTAYFDTLDTAQTSDLPKKGNSTTGLHYSTYVRSLVAILSVAFSLFLVSCTIIYFWTKASCNLRNIRLFETSKKYLEKNMDRTTSAAHMLSDLKYEDDDFSGVYRT